MRIDGVGPPSHTGLTPQAKAASRSKSDRAPSTDRVEIAQRPPEAEVLSAKLRAMTEEDNPRLEEVQQRLQSGYYETPQVREQIVDSLLGANSWREVFDDVAQLRIVKSELSQVPDVRQGRVEEARSRVDSGFYDAPEIRRQIAARILEELG